jgi:outer membrane protein assembly factor BamD (BamD/ComL family)
MSKLKKEELEQDILLEYSSRFMHFYQTNKATVIGGGVGIILAVALVIGYVIYSGQQEQEASVLLGMAEQELMMGNYETALYGNDEEFTLGFVQIANNYGGTDSGNLAHYYASVSEFELGNYEDALTYIEDFTPPEGILGVAAISLHANILLQLENFEEAAVQYERAAEWDENNATTPANLLEAAQAYLRADNTQMATNHLERIVDEFPNSPQAARAERMIGNLTAS